MKKNIWILVPLLLSKSTFLCASQPNQNANANAFAIAQVSSGQSVDAKVNDELARNEDVIAAVLQRHGQKFQRIVALVNQESSLKAPFTDVAQQFKSQPTAIQKANKGDLQIRLQALLSAVIACKKNKLKKEKSLSDDVAYHFLLSDVKRTALRYFAFFKEQGVSVDSIVSYMYQSSYQAEIHNVHSLLQIIEEMRTFYEEYWDMTPAKVVADLMQKTAVPQNTLSEKNIELFGDAVKSDNLACAQQMLRTKEVPVNVRDALGCPIFLYAVAHDLPNMVDLLCKQGFNVNSHDLYGRNARLLSPSQKMLEILQRKANQPRLNLLEQNELGNTAYHTAACADQPFVCRALQGIEAKIALEKNKDGKNALQLAIENGSCRVVEVLTELPYFGVKEHDSFGRQPMIHAFLAQKNCKKPQCSHKCLHATMYEQLEKQGGRKCLNEKGADGLTSLMVAAREGQVDVVQAILEHGGDLTISVKGKRALQHAQDGKQKARQTKLPEYDRVIDLLNEKGATAHEIKLQKQIEAQEEKARTEAQASIEQQQSEEQVQTPQPQKRISKAQLRKEDRKSKHEAKMNAEKELDAAAQVLVDAPFTPEQSAKIKEFEQRKKSKALTFLRVDAEIQKENRELLNQARSFNARNIKKDALAAWRILFKKRIDAVKIESDQALQQLSFIDAKKIVDQHHVALKKNLSHHLAPLVVFDLPKSEESPHCLRWFDNHLNYEIASCISRYQLNQGYAQASRTVPHIECDWCKDIIDTQYLTNSLARSSAHQHAVMVNKIKAAAFKKSRAKLQEIEQRKLKSLNPGASAFKPLRQIQED